MVNNKLFILLLFIILLCVFTFVYLVFTILGLHTSKLPFYQGGVVSIITSMIVITLFIELGSEDE